MSAAEAERDAVRAGCERFVRGHGEDARRPARVLRELADAVDAGDEADSYGSGAIVERLERRVAGLLGKPAAAFMPSGTMAQQIALRIFADRRVFRGIAYHPTCHLEIHEGRAYQLLHGLHARLVGHRDRLLRVADLEEVHEPLAALLLELPQREIGGQLPTFDELCAQVAWAREHGLFVHLDGARLWEAQVFYDRPLPDIARLFDTVYVSFYKGLGGIAGCALAGPDDVIAEARVWQARHGGRLVSAYPLLLSAERGLDERLPRMPEYVAHMRAIAAALSAVDGVRVVPDPPHVNMAHLLLAAPVDRIEQTVLEIGRERGVWLFERAAPALDPRAARVELTVGDATLSFEPQELAALLGELVERAAAG